MAWDFWIDCGGTFTDIVAVSNDGEYKTEKLLSNSPHYKSAVVEGIKRILGDAESFKAIGHVRLGTTVATNAFLERNGIKCGLVTTLGFRDLLEIRQQNRPSLFDLDIEKAAPLYSDVVQVKERIDARGKVVIELDEEIARFELQRLLDSGTKSVSISLMHATLNPSHELRIGSIAKELGFDYVSLSHQTSPVSKYIFRAETSVVDSYLTPLLDIYTQQLQKDLEGARVVYMQSSGGLCEASALKGQNALLSGPAGGLIGAIESCRRRGIDKIITFDMGGTSTDVSIFDGRARLDNEPVFHGLKLLAPMMDIHTVAAGGGSVLKYDQGRFVVGPESAGAYPGPACYRNGGPLTVTDANLYLGRLEASKFPKIFGPKRDEGLDEEVVAEKFSELGKLAGMSAQEVAQGFIEVAANTMARAIKKVSVERGKDPAEFTMVSFGGAAGQLACKVADAIGIKNVFCHPFSSVLSAYGIGLANETFSAMAGIARPLKELDQQSLDVKFNTLHQEILERLPGAQTFDDKLLMRAIGSDYEISVDTHDLLDSIEQFSYNYSNLFGVQFEGEIEVLGLSSTGIFESGYRKELINDREEETLSGPKVLSANNTCIVFDEGWRGVKNQHGEWVLSKASEQRKSSKLNEKVELEIFYQKFQSIAEQMGHTLQSLAHSITIKERNDFSCAIFTADSELLANAPHIPVHLGSMGDAVDAVSKQFSGEIREGDSFICNDPNFGGTHLPDITIVTPIFMDGQISLFVASRGHHGDIGGISPGSMPGGSKTLEEEGVVIRPARVVSQGRFLEPELKELLTNSKYPARNPKQNIHDIKAQIAANQKAIQELSSLSKAFGTDKVVAMGEAILDYSHQKIKTALKGFKSGKAQIHIASERKIALAMENTGDRLKLDFSGTSDCSPGNFNTPLPVVKASILFALRCLIKENIPLNDGISRYLEIKAPQGSLLNPKPDSAVVAGNVETSQVISDLLFEALKVKAHSQGTMNNLSFGNESYQYYETLGGGSGATANGNGASAVQVNMTNSLLTDPEVFETRLPVRIELMGIRRGSGGAGERYGGDGVYRRLLFLEDSTVNMISQRRESAPGGIRGGDKALRGQNFVERAGATIERLGDCFQIELKANDRLNVLTPGGGGFGTPTERSRNLVFAFGSNMDERQIKNRCPSSKFLARARLFDFELRYSIYSDMRQGGVADTFHAPGKHMWGAVYELDDKDLERLDEIECAKGHYARVVRNVIGDDDREYEVFCYDVNDKDPDITPSKTYRWLVYSGAYMLGCPKAYLDSI